MVAKAAVYRATDHSVVTSIVFALLIGVAVGWGSVDGWLRREDRWLNWFYAGIIAGPVAGVLSVIGRATLVDQTGVAELKTALTTHAAFTALLVMVPAALGMLVGATVDTPKRRSAAMSQASEAPARRRHRRPTGKAPARTAARKPSPTQSAKPSPAKRVSRAPSPGEEKSTSGR